MFKEFKEFAVRGNVLDLAVGLVIGAAFGKIVTSLVNDVLIALSARSIGATVVTNNASDFAAIRDVRAFKLTVVPT